ncbi:low quality protein: tubulin polyglutamylase ttll6 [Stylonychia lemnae]|uniref:Low quality protein: tubulin polyglutamylase ttll6 n=1 Tax=Stylonychia lemnae TaxID=5949 RepID=A0A077ZZ70_STYLE|nr:low quality protein: tubulin polyglutamylase ttll6 [Stylonychia lemnae]|eukprot:CDW74877.1 low quality protein: tubulin polyglutamylase ttll6 [Stylonychia lemnae]
MYQQLQQLNHYPYSYLEMGYLNKKNQNFDGEKHKLKLSQCLNRGMTQQSEKGIYTKSSDQIWNEIEDIVIKTVITIQPQLQHYYRSCQPKEPDLCYELLGFDIILDRKLKPWLLEVNHLPSFNSDTQTDEQVKYELIRDVFNILNLSIEHRKKIYKEMKADQMRQAQQNGCYKRLNVREHVERVRFDPATVAKLNPSNKFRLIYPKPNGDDQYEKYQKKAHEIWQMTTGTFRQIQAQSQVKEPKKKKTLKSRHRKQSQILLQQQTAEQIVNEELNDPLDHRMISDNEQYDQNITLADVNKGEKLLDNDDTIKVMSPMTENQDSISLLKERRQIPGVSTSMQTSHNFFDKRQSYQPKIQQQSQQAISSLQPKISKQNSQRQSLKQNIIRQTQSNPRPPNQGRQNQTATSMFNQIKHKGGDLIKSNEVLTQQQTEELLKVDKFKDENNSANKILENTINGPNQNLNESDIMHKLQMNNGQLKYKEYCKALIDDFNQAYYKSQYYNGLNGISQTSSNNPQQNLQNQTQNTQITDNTRSISQGVSLANSNINTLIIQPQNVVNGSQNSTFNTFYNHNFATNIPSGNLNSQNQYMKKLKHVIHSNANRSNAGGGILGRQNRQGMLIGSLVSPGNHYRQIQSKTNPFQQQVVKSKEDLAILNMALNQRVLMRSDSIQNKQNAGITNNAAVVDMAPINLSAGIIDFKVQYKKQHKRFHPTSASQNGPGIQGQFLKNQQKALLNQQKLQKNHISPKLKLQWINESADLVNYITHNEENQKEVNQQINNKNKREQKNSRILSIENYAQDRNLDRLKEYEKKLQQNFSYQQQSQ